MKKIEYFLEALSNYLLPSSNDNLKIVVLCVIAATTFWIFNALNGSYITKIDYPISVQYADSTHMPIKPLPEYIELEVNGGGWNLLRRTLWFEGEPLRIKVSQPEQTKFVLAASLQSSLIDQMTDLRLTQILTDTIWIDLDLIAEKTIRIIVDSMDISLEQDYRIVSPIQLSSDTVFLRGPNRFLKNVSTIYNLEIEDNKISSNFDKRLDLPDFGSELIVKSPRQVQVNFEVAKYVNSSFKVRVEVDENMPNSVLNDWFLADSLAEVIITHRERALQESVLDSLKLKVDFRKMNRNDSTVLPQILYVPQALKPWEISLVPMKLRSNE